VLPMSPDKSVTHVPGCTEARKPCRVLESVTYRSIDSAVTVIDGVPIGLTRYVGVPQNGVASIECDGYVAAVVDHSQPHACLYPGAFVRGQLERKVGAVLPCDLAVTGSSVMQRATTDENGFFECGPVPIGRIHISLVKKDSYILRDDANVNLPAGPVWNLGLLRVNVLGSVAVQITRGNGSRVFGKFYWREQDALADALWPTLDMPLGDDGVADFVGIRLDDVPLCHLWVDDGRIMDSLQLPASAKARAPVPMTMKEPGVVRVTGLDGGQDRKLRIVTLPAAFEFGKTIGMAVDARGNTMIRSRYQECRISGDTIIDRVWPEATNIAVVDDEGFVVDVVQVQVPPAGLCVARFDPMMWHRVTVRNQRQVSSRIGVVGDWGVFYRTVQSRDEVQFRWRHGVKLTLLSDAGFNRRDLLEGGTIELHDGE
ncbi:MAG TPA: hypothetical protein PKE00_02980, partial [Planctomycetota bacterium]|nr:hypothetical protein [Planctomycetota bacterium]